MYDIISQVISHIWQDGLPEQSYIYHICSCIIPLFFVWVLGEVTSLLCFFRRKSP